MTSEVEGQTGYLVLNLEGSVLSSGGDLESDQRAAATILQLVKTAGQGELEANKITINYSDHSYVICSSNKKIHVVKKSINCSEILA